MACACRNKALSLDPSHVGALGGLLFGYDWVVTCLRSFLSEDTDSGHEERVEAAAKEDSGTKFELPKTPAQQAGLQRLALRPGGDGW